MSTVKSFPDKIITRYRCTVIPFISPTSLYFYLFYVKEYRLIDILHTFPLWHRFPLRTAYPTESLSPLCIEIIRKKLSIMEPKRKIACTKKRGSSATADDYPTPRYSRTTYYHQKCFYSISRDVHGAYRSFRDISNATGCAAIST